jgi:hypothetical protein
VVSQLFEDAGVFSEGHAAVKADGRWGYIDKTGRVVIKPQFESAEPFSDGLAAVSVGVNRVGYVDTAGQVAIPPTYVSGRKFTRGLARVTKMGAPGRGTAMSYIDKSGKEVWSSDAR